jgi:hypothetical protein
MRIPKIRLSRQLWWIVVFLALGYFTTGTSALAQCTNRSNGYNTVYGSCNNTAKQGSFAMVDASQFPGTDICAQIYAAFSAFMSNNNNAPTNGIVVDARGIAPSDCTSGSPWRGWGFQSNSNPLPNVVLLPSGIIPIHGTWIMPSNTRLIGEGPGTLGTNGVLLGGTTLQVDTTFAGSEMIDMGPASSSPGAYCSSFGNLFNCPGVQIEHLRIDGTGGGQNLSGIVNYWGQELSYVEDVAFSNLSGTALTLYGNTAGNNLSYSANNSGPYSNLTMTGVNHCLNINGTYGTRGVHGLYCSSKGSPAIYVDAPNNTLEDITLARDNGATEGTDGILIGSNSPAENNLLFNIRSVLNGQGFGFRNLIHLRNMANLLSTCPATTTGGSSTYNVCDITIMGVTNGSGNNTINDEVGGTALTDPSLGMYILGEPVQSGLSTTVPINSFLGYSHFTTSPNWPSWAVGTSQRQGASCTGGVGSLFSVTSGSGTTLWECEFSGWQPVK